MEKIYKDYWFSYMKKRMIITLPTFVFFLIISTIYNCETSIFLSIASLAIIGMCTIVASVYFVPNEIKFSKSGITVEKEYAKYSQFQKVCVEPENKLELKTNSERLIMEFRLPKSFFREEKIAILNEFRALGKEIVFNKLMFNIIDTVENGENVAPKHKVMLANIIFILLLLLPLIGFIENG